MSDVELIAAAQAMADNDASASIATSVWTHHMCKLCRALEVAHGRVAELEARLEALNAGDLAKAYLLSAGPAAGRGFEFAFKTGVAAVFAEGLAELLEAEGAGNYVTATATHERLGPLEFTVRRLYGETSPQMEIKALKVRVAELEAAQHPRDTTPDEGVDVLVQDASGAIFTAVYCDLDGYGVWWPHARPGEDIPADPVAARERGDAPVVRWWPLPHGAAPIPGWPTNPDALAALGPERSSDPGQLADAPKTGEGGE